MWKVIRQYVRKHRQTALIILIAVGGFKMSILGAVALSQIEMPVESIVELSSAVTVLLFGGVLIFSTIGYLLAMVYRLEQVLASIEWDDDAE